MIVVAPPMPRARWPNLLDAERYEAFIAEAAH